MRHGAVGGYRWSVHGGGADDDPPGGEAFLADLTIGGGGQPVAARAEVVGDGAVRGEEALGMPR